jgi:hypothetical protein
MKTYTNSYFRLGLDFPDAWELTSWRHSKISRSWQSLYQARDDELPTEGKCTSKFLFTAARHPPESEALVDPDIEFSVFYVSPAEDMRKSLVDNFERQRAYYESSGIVNSIAKEGVWTVGSMEFSYVDQESKSRRGQSWFRFIFRPFNKTFWLYGKIAGHKRHAHYEEALEIVQGLTSSAEAIG